MGAYANFVGIVVLALLYLILAKAKALPSAAGFQQFATTLNTKGGNLVVLIGFSVLFFGSALHLIYYVLENTRDGKIDTTNAFVALGVSFVTGPAFGGAFASLLKVMTGEEAKPPIVAGTKEETVKTVVSSESSK